MLLTWDGIALPEHACTAVFICTWVFLQGIGRSLQFVDEVWIEDVELIALHDLKSQQWRSSTGRDSSIIVTPYCGVQLPDPRSQLVLLNLRCPYMGNTMSTGFPSRGRPDCVLASSCVSSAVCHSSMTCKRQRQ